MSSNNIPSNLRFLTAAIQTALVYLCHALYILHILSVVSQLL